jgi:hypothetical protein
MIIIWKSYFEDIAKGKGGIENAELRNENLSKSSI